VDPDQIENLALPATGRGEALVAGARDEAIQGAEVEAREEATTLAEVADEEETIDQQLQLQARPRKPPWNQSDPRPLPKHGAATAPIKRTNTTAVRTWSGALQLLLRHLLQLR